MSVVMGSGLAMLTRADAMLAECTTTQDALDLMDLAATARSLAERMHLGASSINHATVIHLLAQQRLADVVDAGQAAGQIATKGKPVNVLTDNIKPATLPSLGVKASRLRQARIIRDTYTPDEIRELGTAAAAQDKAISPSGVAKDATRTHRQTAKAAKVADIVAHPAGIMPVGPFAVLYADPPWRYEHADPTRAIENQYPTMTTAEICALHVPAADNAVLLLWATSPKLVEALSVMQSWGFEYRTNMVWVKQKIGMGYYARQQHELLLIGRRGKLPVPDPEDRPSSVIAAPRGEHSEKPDAAYDVIERMYPTAERCELFQRRPRTGWAAWGNQVDQ